MAFGEIIIYITTFFGLFTAIYFLYTIIEVRKNLRKGEIDTYPAVTICVPCYNEETTVVKTLRSLSHLDYDKKQLEIIVVDDGSKDQTYEKAKAFARKNPKIDIKVFRQKNGGKFTALNLAIKKCRGDFFGALDADSFVHPKALRRIMKFFEKKPEVQAVTPSMKVYNPKGILQRVQAIEYLIGIFLRKVFAEIGSIHVTPGPLSIYRMSFFKKHGTYHEAHHTEDIEMALRIQRNHGVIENAIDAYVYTIAPDNWRILKIQRLRWYFGFIKNVTDYTDLFGRKHGNLGLFILPASFISVAIVLIFLFYFIYQQLDLWITRYLNIAAVNFDIFQLKWISWDLFFINTTAGAVLGVIALITGILIIIVAKKIAKEEKPIALSYIIFMAVYWILFGYWWLISVITTLTKKKRKSWGHKTD